MNELKANIAVFTMVMDDEIFLQIWLRHWLKHLEPHKIFVIDDGPSKSTEQICAEAGVNYIVAPDRTIDAQVEKQRWKFISDKVSDFLNDFDIVIYNDCDEILLVDPVIGTLETVLSSVEAAVTHPLGIEIMGRKKNCALDFNSPILRQRPYYRFTHHFSKGCIFTKPVALGSGGHAHDSLDTSFPKGLYLAHLKYFDMTIYMERSIKALDRPSLKGRRNAGVVKNKWKLDEAGVRDHGLELQRRKLFPVPVMMDKGIRHRIKNELPKNKDDHGLYRLPSDHSRFDYILPRRFRLLL